MKHFNKIVLSLVILLLAQFLFVQQSFAQISATKPTVNIIATLPSTLKSGDTFTTYYTLGGSPTYVEYYFTGPENIASAQSPRRSSNVANNFSATMSDIYGKTVRDGFYVMYLRACNTAGCSNFFGSSIEVNANAVPIVPTNPVFSTTTPPISYKQPTFSAGNDLELVLPDNRIAPSGQFATAGTQGIDTILWQYVKYPPKGNVDAKISLGHTMKPQFYGFTVPGTYVVELSVEDRINNLFVDRMNIVVLAEGTVKSIGGLVPPSDVQAIPGTCGSRSNIIKWATVPGAKNYNVAIFDQVKNKTTLIETVDGTSAARYVHTLLTPGETYVYKVEATNSQGTSGYSRISASAVAPTNCVPNASPEVIEIYSVPKYVKEHNTVAIHYTISGKPSSVEYFVTGPMKIGSFLSPLSSEDVRSGISLSGPLSNSLSAILGQDIAPPGTYTVSIRGCKGSVCGRYAATEIEVFPNYLEEPNNQAGLPGIENNFSVTPSTVRTDGKITFTYKLTNRPTYLEYYVDGPVSQGSSQSPVKLSNVSGTFTETPTNILGKVAPDGIYTIYFRACNNVCGKYHATNFAVDSGVMSSVTLLNYMGIVDVLKKPSNLSAIAPRCNTVTVSWDPVPGALSYSVAQEVSQAAGYTVVGKVSQNSGRISYSVSNLDSGKTFKFKVLARNGHYATDFSDEVASVTTQANCPNPVSPNQTLPNPTVTILNPKIHADGDIAFSWSSPSSIDTLEFYIAGPSPAGTPNQPGRLPATMSGQKQISLTQLTGVSNLKLGNYTMYVRSAKSGLSPSNYVRANFEIVDKTVAVSPIVNPGDPAAPTDPEAVKKTPRISITNSSVTVNDFMTITWSTQADIDSLEYYVTGPTPIGSAAKPGTIPATRSGEVKVRPIDVTGNRNMLPGTYTLYVRGAMVGEQSSPYVSTTFVVVQSQAQLLGDLTVKLQSSPAVLRSNDNLYVNYGVTGSADRIEYYIDGPLKLGEPLRPVASTNLFGPLTITPTAIFSTVAPDGVYYAFMRACKGTVCGRFARTTFVVSATALPTLPTPTPMLPPNQQPPIVPPTPMLPPNTSPVMALAQYILNLTAFYQSLAAYEKNPVGTRPTPPPAPAF